MSIVEEFLLRYNREYDFFEQLARLCAQRCEAALVQAGVRAIVTARAKRPDRLREKLWKRNETKQYATVEQIREDLVDLSGVRVALYFPGDRDEVARIITANFTVLRRKDFPESAPPSHPSYANRFLGYAATHFHVCLPEDLLADEQRRYADARVEIQVASVLMHAWAEVGHDLAYKPFSGELSRHEYELLDQLNGLVLSGEITLNTLQRAVSQRLTALNTPIRNHYELASYLYDYSRQVFANPTFEPRVGRVDVLLRLLQLMGLDKPNQVRAILESTTLDPEGEPIVQQIVDALIARDRQGYELYARASREVDARGAYQPIEAADEREESRATRAFLAHWEDLEQAIREATWDRSGPFIPALNERALRPVVDKHLLDAADAALILRLRRVRNDLVHGPKHQPADAILEAARTVEELTTRLRARLHDHAALGSHGA